VLKKHQFIAGCAHEDNTQEIRENQPFFYFFGYIHVKIMGN